jgi:shikimate kinase
MEGAANLVLVGPMGSGKSSIGRSLADRLGLRFVDADTEIERLAGASIPTLFDNEGEAGFRTRERETLARLLQGEGQAVATGGGAVLDAGNRERMRARGFVVWLQASIEVQLQRLAGDHGRPLLLRDDRADALQRLAAQRTPLYAEVADAAFDTDALDEAGVADALARLLRGRWQAGRP